jgi:hypothetical protein
MGLYTRDQMIEAFNYGQKLEKFDWIGDMIDSLEAIELPSDSLCINCDESESTITIFVWIVSLKLVKRIFNYQVMKEIKKMMELDGMEFDEFDPYDVSYLGGATWMRNKIQGNKDNRESLGN